jgi:hypothetical protein
MDQRKKRDKKKNPAVGMCVKKNGVIGIFYSHNLSGRTMSLGSTQPLTEINPRNISFGGGGGW